ncbi:MAG: ABC transporter permease [Actinomycetota bacterium]
MTAATTAITTTSSETTAKVTTLRVIRSEWIKFWSVRSTSITLLAAGIATVVFGMIFSAVADSDDAAGPTALLSDPVDIALGGIGLTEMVIGVLGVMVVAGEYSTGLIRTAFAAAGRRSKVIFGKVAVVAAGVFAVSAVAVTAAIALGQAVYAGDLDTVPVTDVLDVIFGTTVYLVGIALIGIALGFVLRSTAAGIGTLVGGVFIGPNLLNLLPESVTDVFLKYLPSEAGSAMMTQVSDPDLLSRGAGYAVFAAWVVGLLALAAFLVQRRDA